MGDIDDELSLLTEADVASQASAARAAAAEREDLVTGRALVEDFVRRARAGGIARAEHLYNTRVKDEGGYQGKVTLLGSHPYGSVWNVGLEPLTGAPLP